MPLIMFSATPVPALPLIVISACWFMPGGVVADVAFDGDLHRCVDADGDIVRAVRDG